MKDHALLLSNRLESPGLQEGMEKTLWMELQLRQVLGLYREVLPLEGPLGPLVRVRGREAIMLASNDYLGLAGDQRVLEAAARALQEEGWGAGGSRLVSGTFPSHKGFEAAIARFKGAERALLFGSGYLANLGILSSLLRPGDFLFSDAFNHASLIDGARLSRAEVRVFRHNNLNHLETLLGASPVKTRKLIVTEGVFSMEGDLGRLPELSALAKRYGAWLMVDDAHGTGVLGEQGRGTAEHFGVVPEIQMGTLGKALGGFGAYVCGSKTLVDHLLNSARTFVYTTAPPPAAAAAARRALEIVEGEPERREKLRENAHFLRSGLQNLGFEIPKGATPIIPIMTGEAERTMALSKKLLELGVFVRGIRPPTVPEGRGRLRVTVMATHQRSHLEQALDAFERAGRALGFISGWKRPSSHRVAVHV